jgi:hypothetical protein
MVGQPPRVTTLVTARMPAPHRRPLDSPTALFMFDNGLESNTKPAPEWGSWLSGVEMNCTACREFGALLPPSTNPNAPWVLQGTVAASNRSRPRLDGVRGYSQLCVAAVHRLAAQRRPSIGWQPVPRGQVPLHRPHSGISPRRLRKSSRRGPMARRSASLLTC